MTELERQAIEVCGKLLIDETFEYNNVECVVLSDAEICYIQGYKDAIDKACKWLRYNRWKYTDSREGNEAMEDDFRKAMKGE